MNDITYKHIEITSRPYFSKVVEGRVTFSIGNRMLVHSHICDSEADCLVALNEAVKVTLKQLEEQGK